MHGVVSARQAGRLVPVSYARCEKRIPNTYLRIIVLRAIRPTSGIRPG